MIFSCTKKVLDKLKKYKSIDNSKEEPGLSNWYVDLINLERKNYFLFTNSKTLFSFFLYVGTKKEHQQIELLFEEKLREMIVREVGSNPRYIKNAFDKSDSYKFVKTNSRSVLGSMNDIKQQIQIQIWHKGELNRTYDSINHYLNIVPMGALKYETAGSKMKSELDFHER